MITTLTGLNSFQLKSALDKRVNAFVAEHGDIALEKLDGEEAEFERIQEALQSVPFLASKKMVVLRNPSANREFAEKAEGLLKDLPETTELVIVEPKFDKRLSLYKLLKKTTEFHEFNELDVNGLARWLSEQAKARNGSLNAADARFLVERVGASQQLLAGELDKLILYNSEISRATIELLTEPAPQSTIFELLEAAFGGNTKRALDLYREQRSLKVEPQEIIAMLGWQLRVLAFIKTGGERSIDDIARDAKLNSFVVRKSAGIARSLTLAQLKRLVSDLLAIDARLKSESLDADEALQHYLLQVSG